MCAQDWIDVATKALAERGPDALTIDALCVRAGKTKGSFYAHFDSHDAFLVALAADWRERNTLAAIRRADAAPTPCDRMAVLNHIAARLDPGLDHGMRMLGDRHPLVASAVAEVEEIRIGYLADLYRATGSHSETEARDLATLEYAAYVGLQLVGSKRAPHELERLHGAFTKLTSPGCPEVTRNPELEEKSPTRAPG